MPSAGEPVDRVPALRASDAERELAVATLRDGAEHGRLTFDELAQRTELAYQATTAAELDRLVADLPAREPSAPVPAVRVRKRRRFSVAILSACERHGRWRPAAHGIAFALMGSVTLDLRDATLDSDELTITAFSLMGSVEVIVPEGVDVDLGGFAILGATENHLGTAPIRPGTPVVRVRGFSLMGAVEVEAKPPRT